MPVVRGARNVHMSVPTAENTAKTVPMGIYVLSAEYATTVPEVTITSVMNVVFVKNT